MFIFKKNLKHKKFFFKHFFLENWVVDDPIRKQTRLPSPKREYQNTTSLPFKDFSYL